MDSTPEKWPKMSWHEVVKARELGARVTETRSLKRAKNNRKYPAIFSRELGRISIDVIDIYTENSGGPIVFQGFPFPQCLDLSSQVQALRIVTMD